VIVAVGAVDEYVGARTEVVSLHGARLIPGFQDAHVHAIWGGLELAACDLSGTRTEAEYLARVAAYAHEHSTVDWIHGGGWAMEAFPGGQPHRAALDTIVPDRPVFLHNRDHHGAWVNSRALQLAGITDATPDPVGGRIERDERGEPTGMLQEAAVGLVGELLPLPGPAQLRAALLRAQAMLYSYGIVAWQDAIVGEALGQPDTLASYVDAAHDGVLTARVRGALWWRRDAGAEQIGELIARREHAAGQVQFQPTAVKVMIDGICENLTAALGAPYLDGCRAPECDTGATGHEQPTAGLTFVDGEALPGYVTALDHAGFQVHFHALGDRAVRLALDAIAAARTANGPSGGRHHLAHLQLVDPADVPRFAALDAGANIQAYWATHEPQMDELTIPLLGPTRTRWQYPFGALHRAGARLVAGSDWPVTTADPLQAIHVAVNRTLPADDAPVFLPDQRLDLATALAAYTAGSAWANGFDDSGTIRVGARADLAILSPDPFTRPPDEIAATRVTHTYVAGVRVHSPQ
jgi:predicted amidohydrolase YtcJ